MKLIFVLPLFILVLCKTYMSFSIRTLLSIYESISVTAFQSEVCISLLRLSASVRMKNYFPKNGISRKVVTAAFSMLFLRHFLWLLKMQMSSYLFWFQKILHINYLKNLTFPCTFWILSWNVNTHLNKR